MQEFPYYCGVDGVSCINPIPCAPKVLSQHLIEYTGLFLHKHPILLLLLGELKLTVGSTFGLGVATVFNRI
jgi:hypothetical protein